MAWSATREPAKSGLLWMKEANLQNPILCTYEVQRMGGLAI